MTKNTVITTAQDDADLRQILALQRHNLRSAVNAETARSQGFVTVRHDLPTLQLFQRTAPQIVAKFDGQVVGYALAMPPSLRDTVPVLQPFFRLLDTLEYDGHPLRQQRYFLNGQVCVAEAHRGQGIFDQLMQGYRRELGDRFDWCVTEISVSNPRSLRAHERVGFRVAHQYEDATDRWDVVVWDMKG